MASQPGLQAIAIHILPDISQSKGNKTMKFGQLIEYNKGNIFLQKFYRKWGKEASSRALFYFSKNLNMRWKQGVCSLISIYFDSPQLAYKLYKTLDYWSRDVLNFNFSEKGLGLVSPPHFVYDFSRKMFLMLHCINWPNFIAWLPLLLDILGNICITIVY